MSHRQLDRIARRPAFGDQGCQPPDRQRVKAAEQLAELADQAALTPIEMAIAFVLRYPAVTFVIVRPRSMEHLESLVAAADVALSDALERIDEIASPGMTPSTPPTPGGSARS